MFASKFHFNTLKEAPSDAEVVSHQLMTRAGMIRKHAGGIYSYMPLAQRVLQKIQYIVRTEMNESGAIEILMPMVQPAELWEESGRWQDYGAELLRIKDRHDRDFVLQPTSEEVMTDIARNEIQSWKQLPLNFYHIQTKFRDERRPRFGLMRSREFIMKDAYSFDLTEEGALKSYDNMFETYCRIFDRLQLNFRPVVADTGSIGGSRSHEFQVIADTGEDLIVYNPETDFAANIELAPAPCLIETRAEPISELAKVLTPNCKTCEEVTTFLEQPLECSVKSVAMMILDKEEQAVQLALVLIRADHELNEVKLGKLEIFKSGYRLAHEDEIKDILNTTPGYIGPVGIAENVLLVADETVANMSDFIVGANEAEYHYTGVNWGRDITTTPIIADIRNAVIGDPDPAGKGHYAIQKGIEVGHVFFLGDKYSKMLNANVLNEVGKPQIMQMGCYGIGISRIAAAAIEQNHDDRGIVWPMAIAPFEVVICPLNYNKNEEVKSLANSLYDTLKSQGVDVILDDRAIRPGVMFSDWELIGVPLRITFGEKALKNGEVEVSIRKGQEKRTVPVETHQEDILALYNELKG